MIERTDYSSKNRAAGLEITERDLQRWRSKYSEKKGRKKALVIDQDHDFIAQFAPHARKMGVHVERAFSSREALHSILFEQPEIVFLNPMMDGVSRMDVVETIRNITRNVPVILLLDRDMKKAVKNDSRMGMTNGYFLMPFLAPNLNELVDTVLRSDISQLN